MSFFYFPIGILGQVWYLIVSIPDLCDLTFFIALDQLITKMANSGYGNRDDVN